MARYQIFRNSQVSTDCDQCGGRVDVIKGGVCTRCRQIVCYYHLHGSFFRRLLCDLGISPVCGRCRNAPAKNA